MLCTIWDQVISSLNSQQSKIQVYALHKFKFIPHPSYLHKDDSSCYGWIILSKDVVILKNRVIWGVNRVAGNVCLKRDS